MNEVTSNKSIKSRFRMTIILILLIMSIAFVYTNKMKDNIIGQYSKYADIDIKLSNLSVEFNNRWVYFDLQYREHNIDVITKYYESNEKIQKIIDSILPYLVKDKDSSVYIRNLITMNNRFEKTAYSIMAGEYGNKSYIMYTNMRTLNDYISRHSSSLTSSFLQFSESQYSLVLEKYNMLDQNIYVLLMLAVVMSMVIFEGVNHNILRSIKKISNYAIKISNHEFETPDIEENSYKELDEFANTINSMKGSIKHYIDKLNAAAEAEKGYQIEKIKNIEKDKTIRETELKLLQVQINPHFLFNNLNTISRVAMFEGASKTVEIIDALAKIIRFNITHRSNLIRLSEELEIVKSFVYIQNIKSEDKYEVNYFIDEGLDDTKIPPMIIQLVVENSIKHGFINLNQKGKIDITIQKKNDYVSIEVTDNGVGISEEKLRKILANEKLDYASNSTGLGINNIKKRLELYYDRNDLFAIISSKGLGTKVELFVPIE